MFINIQIQIRAWDYDIDTYNSAIFIFEHAFTFYFLTEVNMTWNKINKVHKYTFKSAKNFDKSLKNKSIDKSGVYEYVLTNWVCKLNYLNNFYKLRQSLKNKSINMNRKFIPESIHLKIQLNFILSEG